MTNERVLFNTSKGSFKSPGGGEIQLLKTREGLEALGFKIKVLEEENYKVDFSEFDIFHNFNIHRDNYDILLKAKKQGLKIAISTIYWPSLRHAAKWNKGIRKKARAVAAEAVNRLDLAGISKVSKIIRMADLLLPNSMAEAAALERIFSVNSDKIFVVPNGVDKRFANAKPGLFEKKVGLGDFVLYVGRIEERKNIISLIRAMKGLEEKLVVIGDAKLGSEAYFEQCKGEAGKNIVFLESMPHNSKLLESAYAACKVFALPSWYETPGLAALEAGLAGANIVVTAEGCTKEYFSDFVSYAGPESVEDIREKILLELQRQKQDGLKRHILKNFLWENAARETALAYEQVLQGDDL